MVVILQTATQQDKLLFHRGFIERRAQTDRQKNLQMKGVGHLWIDIVVFLTIKHNNKIILHNLQQ